MVGRPALQAKGMSRLRGDELLLGAEPVLDGVAPGLEMDVVRTRRDVLPGEHDGLCRLRLLRAARDGLLDRRLLGRGGLGGLAWHFCPLPVVAGLPFRLRGGPDLSCYAAAWMRSCSSPGAGIASPACVLPCNGTSRSSHVSRNARIETPPATRNTGCSAVATASAKA